MNKQELLKEVGNYLDSQEVIYANNIYQKMKVRRSVTRTTASLRTILDNEIIIEIDTDNQYRSYRLAKKVIKRLTANGYNFSVWKAEGQRSPHIHVYDIKGLEKIDHKLNREYKRQWFKKYANWNEVDDKINTKEMSLIVMEDSEHFKYGTLKDLILTRNKNNKISNKLELSILREAENNLKKKDTYNKVSEHSFNNNWFVKWATNEKLPRGIRNNVILKNLAIVTVNDKKDAKIIGEKLSELYNSHAKNSYDNWIKWVLQGHNEFGIWEIIKYCEFYDIDFYSVKRKYSRKRF